MTRAETAENYFREGYNCAQAVVMAFADLTGGDAEFLKAAVLPLGGGLSRLREVCGAVSGGAVCLGLLFSDRSKSEIYALVQQLAVRFREKNGSYRCGELLVGAGLSPSVTPQAEERTQAYYKKRPCAALVYDAAEIVEKIYLENRRDA